MKPRYLYLVCAAVLLAEAVGIPPALADDSALIRRFAQELMQSGEYYRAITEFRRHISYSPDDTLVRRNLYQIARCYTLAGHLIEATQVYDEIRIKYREETRKCILNMVRLSSQLHYFYESVDLIDDYHSQAESMDDSLLVLRGVSNVYLGRYSEARADFGSVGKNGELHGRAQSYIQTVDEGLPLAYKSKVKAAALAFVLPGSGYFYTGKPQTGFAALAVNALLLYTTYECFHEDLQGLGVLSGVFSLSFYFGSIYGTIQDVGRHNQEVRLQFCKQFNL